jgi:hypothetical protein
LIPGNEKERCQALKYELRFQNVAIKRNKGQAPIEIYKIGYGESRQRGDLQNKEGSLCPPCERRAREAYKGSRSFGMKTT